MKNAFLIAAIISCLWTSQAFSHPPSKIEGLMNDKTLEVQVYHQVADPARHLIYRVEIFDSNGKRIVQNFTSQESAEKQVARFEDASVKAGATITIKASCNKFGNLMTSVTVQ